METIGIKADSCYGNTRDVISEHSPPLETARARQVPYNYYEEQSDEVVETGNVRSTKPYACADCPYATDRKNNLRRHRATMHERCERELECCGLTFVSKSELREHVTENHGAGAGYACAECGRRFGRRALMRRHAVVHDGRPSTDVQRRRSTGVSSIGRRYACSECDYTTGHKSNLDRHFRRHSGPLSTSVECQSTFINDDHYLPPTINSADSQPILPFSINRRDLSLPQKGCCCHICLSTLYYHHALPSSSRTTSSSSQAPFMFNYLPPRFDDVAWSFRKSILSDIDMSRLWSQHVDDGPSTGERKDSSSNRVGDLPTSQDSADQLEMVDSLRQERSDDHPTSSTSSAADNDADDVTGTCYRRRRRLRLLPLLHTCRSCSLTFVSQLQLKFHSDLFHRATDVDARPICCRVSRPAVHRS